MAPTAAARRRDVTRRQRIAENRGTRFDGKPGTLDSPAPFYLIHREVHTVAEQHRQRVLETLKAHGFLQISETASRCLK